MKYCRNCERYAISVSDSGSCPYIGEKEPKNCPYYKHIWWKFWIKDPK